LISVFDLEEELRKYTDHKIYLCGDGYDIAKSALSKIKTEDTPLIHQYQSAYSVALCALDASRQELLTTDIELSPVYLRASQAERERLERLEAEKKGQE
jgi:tRNA threonylcarbamoyladenosine biosynthesis protein TsaB